MFDMQAPRISPIFRLPHCSILQGMFTGVVPNPPEDIVLEFINRFRLSVSINSVYFMTHKKKIKDAKLGLWRPS